MRANPYYTDIKYISCNLDSEHFVYIYVLKSLSEYYFS